PSRPPPRPPCSTASHSHHNKAAAARRSNPPRLPWLGSSFAGAARLKRTGRCLTDPRRIDSLSPGALLLRCIGVFASGEGRDAGREPTRQRTGPTTDRTSPGLLVPAGEVERRQARKDTPHRFRG